MAAYAATVPGERDVRAQEGVLYALGALAGALPHGGRQVIDSASLGRIQP
jgi:hypothetical protein